MKKNICKILLIATAMVFGLAGCSAEAKVERQLELGASSMEAGDYDKAIEAYEEVISLDKYEIEGYEGLVAAMIADGRSSEEIEGVVASATDIITELKESEGGLSEEDKAAAERLYINAANAVADDKDAQAAILENGAGVLEESTLLAEAYKEKAESAITEDAAESDTTSSEDNTSEGVGENATVDMEFGEIIHLGANADYPNVLEDLEVHFVGQVFNISLPKDMCVEFEWDLEYGVLKIYNMDKSKYCFLNFSQKPMPYSTEKTYSTTEDVSGLLVGWNYTLIDGATIVDLENNGTILSQRIPVAFDNYIGEFMYCQVYDNKPYDVINENNETIKVDRVRQFMLFYGDANKTSADEISTYIMESFTPIKEENKSVVTNLGQINIITAELSTKYGIPENLILPSDATLRDVNGRIDISIPVSSENEMLDFIMELNNVAPIKDEKYKLYDTLNTTEITKENILEYFTKRQSIALSYEYNGTKCRLNMSKTKDYYSITIIKL